MLSFNQNVVQDHCYVCGSLSSTKCSNCTKIFYCSVEHQRKDWKRHKVNCFSFDIKTNEKLGRYLVAARDIKPNEIVLKESPLVYGPSQITSPVCIDCLQCIQSDEFLMNLCCKICGWPLCSVCAKKIDCKHAECDITIERGKKISMKQYFNPHPMYQWITTLRCLLLSHQSPEKYNKLLKLESHCDERRGTLQWQNDSNNIAKFILRFFNCSNRWTEDIIMKMNGIVQINGHEVPLTEPPHVAIYDNASLLEHSCAPNLTKSFTNSGQIKLWAPYTIRKGEHLSICYSDALWGTIARRNHLYQTKLFYCDCYRCIDYTEFDTNYSLFRCQNGNCTDVCFPKSFDDIESDWSCKTCGKSTNKDFIKKIQNKAERDIDLLAKDNEEQCEKFIQHYSKWLPDNHHYICDVQFNLIQIIGAGGPATMQFITDDKLMYKISICRKLLKLFHKIAAVEARCLGVVYFELHACLAELGRRESQQNNQQFLTHLDESIKNATEAVKFLQNEPIALCEGQICKQALANIESLKLAINSLELHNSSSN